MRCDEIIRLLEKKAPIEYAMDWDHVGLLVGRRDKEVQIYCMQNYCIF